MILFVSELISFNSSKCQGCYGEGHCLAAFKNSLIWRYICVKWWTIFIIKKVFDAIHTNKIRNMCASCLECNFLSHTMCVPMIHSKSIELQILPMRTEESIRMDFKVWWKSRKYHIRYKIDGFLFESGVIWVYFYLVFFYTFIGVTLFWSF